MLIVSACLAGVNCRYDGKNTVDEYIRQLVIEGKAMAVCPEQIGGLETPRACCEIIHDEEGNKKVMGNDDKDYTEQYVIGAKKTLEIAKIIDADKAVLKFRSPSCGYGKIYDGTFKGILIEGNGIAAQLLEDNGIKVYSEMEIDKLKHDLGE